MNRIKRIETEREKREQTEKRHREYRDMNMNTSHTHQTQRRETAISHPLCVRVCAALKAKPLLPAAPAPCAHPRKNCKANGQLGRQGKAGRGMQCAAAKHANKKKTSLVGVHKGSWKVGVGKVMQNVQ